MGTTSTIRPIRLLVIEDNIADVVLVRRMLNSMKYLSFEVIQSGSLEEATSQLKQPLDLVLLDLNLPDSQDLETLRRVRSIAPAVPVSSSPGWKTGRTR